MHWMLFLCSAELLAYFYFRMGKQCFVGSYGNTPCYDSPKWWLKSCPFPVIGRWQRTVQKVPCSVREEKRLESFDPPPSWKRVLRTGLEGQIFTGSRKESLSCTCGTAQVSSKTGSSLCFVLLRFLMDRIMWQVSERIKYNSFCSAKL